MATFEIIGGQINHRYLMNKTKHDLASTVMLYLELWEKERAKNRTLEAKLTEAAVQFATYRKSEGCSCCQDTETHEKAEARLGALFGAPRYEDDSGVDWGAIKCDGNHAGPACPDPECWHEE